MFVYSPYRESTLASERPDQHILRPETKSCIPSQTHSGGCSYLHSPFLSLLSFLPLSLSLPLSSPRSILCNSFRSCSSLSRESWELVFLFCNIFSIFFPISSKSLSSAELLSVSVDKISVDSRTLKQEEPWKSVRSPHPKKSKLACYLPRNTKVKMTKGLKINVANHYYKNRHNIFAPQFSCNPDVQKINCSKPIFPNKLISSSTVPYSLPQGDELLICGQQNTSWQTMKIILPF